MVILKKVEDVTQGYRAAQIRSVCPNKVIIYNPNKVNTFHSLAGFSQSESGISH